MKKSVQMVERLMYVEDGIDFTSSSTSVQLRAINGVYRPKMLPKIAFPHCPVTA